MHACLHILHGKSHLAPLPEACWLTPCFRGPLTMQQRQGSDGRVLRRTHAGCRHLNKSGIIGSGVTTRAAIMTSRCARCHSGASVEPRRWLRPRGKGIYHISWHDYRALARTSSHMNHTRRSDRTATPRTATHRTAMQACRPQTRRWATAAVIEAVLPAATATAARDSAAVRAQGSHGSQSMML